MSETDVKIIDGKEFIVGHFLFFKSRELENRIVRLVVPVLAEVAGSFKDGEIDSLSLDKLSFDGEGLSKAATKLFSTLTPAEYKSLLMEIFSTTSCTFEKGDKKTSLELNSELNFDIAFGPHVVTMYKAIAFVAEVNFPDYFGSAALIGSKMKKTLTLKLAELKAEKE